MERLVARLGLLLCCAFVLVCGVRQARRYSPTYDETAHLVAGWTYATLGDYRLNPEHPPLVKLLAALPLLTLRPWPEPRALSGAARPDDPTSLRLAREAFALGFREEAAQWYVAHEVWFGVRDGTLARVGAPAAVLVPTTTRLGRSDFFNDVERIFFRARLPVVGLGLLVMVVAFLWAREIWGEAGGLLAAALCAFDPNLLAHSALVTTDVAAAALALATAWLLWRACRRLAARDVALAAIAFGLALATKFSCALLLPIAAALLLGRALARDAWPCRRPLCRRAHRLAAAGAVTATLALSGWLVVWSAYGFRWSAAAEPAPGRRFATEAVLRRSADADPTAREARLGPGARLALAAQRAGLLPEAFVHGAALARANAQQRASFLRGERSTRGFASYFLWTFALKTPLPALAAVALALLLAARRRLGGFRALDLAFLIVPAVAWFVACTRSDLHIGHRHLLPALPFLYVLAGGLVGPWRALGSRARAAVGAAALGWIALASSVVLAPPWRPQIVHPDYLTYFNELAGGPRAGSRHLLGANLDWGQDLPALARWLDERGVREPVGLCYSGSADPRYWGIAHVNLSGCYSYAPRAPLVDAPRWLAIGASRLPEAQHDPALREDWRRLLEGAKLVDTVGGTFLYRLREQPLGRDPGLR